jgi:hypothetical protein
MRPWRDRSLGERRGWKSPASATCFGFFSGPKWSSAGNAVRVAFASEALAAGISIFELSRLMGASVKEIDRTYGHLVRDSEEAIRARLDARSERSGVFLASGEDGGIDG